MAREYQFNKPGHSTFDSRHPCLDSPIDLTDNARRRAERFEANMHIVHDG
jgi:hypothetical protein